jgi:hypothetical protein
MARRRTATRRTTRRRSTTTRRRTYAAPRRRSTRRTSARRAPQTIKLVIEQAPVSVAAAMSADVISAREVKPQKARF